MTLTSCNVEFIYNFYTPLFHFHSGNLLWLQVVGAQGHYCTVEEVNVLTGRHLSGGAWGQQGLWGCSLQGVLDVIFKIFCMNLKKNSIVKYCIVAIRLTVLYQSLLLSMQSAITWKTVYYILFLKYTFNKEITFSASNGFTFVFL